MRPPTYLKNDGVLAFYRPGSAARGGLVVWTVAKHFVVVSCTLNHAWGPRLRIVVAFSLFVVVVVHRIRACKLLSNELESEQLFEDGVRLKGKEEADKRSRQKPKPQRGFCMLMTQ